MTHRDVDLSRLFTEPVEHRLYLATDPQSDPGILRQLSKDPFWFVRDRVATNRKTPADCLQELLQDPDFRVQAEAKKTLTALAKLVSHDPNRETPSGLDAQIAAAEARASAQTGSLSPEISPQR